MMDIQVNKVAMGMKKIGRLWGAKDIELTGPGATSKILEVMGYHFCVTLLKSETA